jgi:UDP-N-acetyl-D-galactosamine dehydrogenase
LVHDPLAEHEEAVAEYGIHLTDWKQLKGLDGLVLAVAHKPYVQMDVTELLKPLRSCDNGVLIDVKSVLNPGQIPGALRYWRL